MENQSHEEEMQTEPQDTLNTEPAPALAPEPVDPLKEAEKKMCKHASLCLGFK